MSYFPNPPGSRAFDGDYPTPTDDETQGFVFGDEWRTITSAYERRTYVCLDNTATAAVWAAVVVVSESDPTTSEDVTQGFFNGCMWTSLASKQVFQLVDEDNGIWITAGRGNW